MGIIEILVYPIGTVSFLSALAFTRYAIGNARLMRGPLGHRLMAVGAVFFIIAALVGAVDHFFFPGSGLVYAQSLIWTAGLMFIVAGGWRRAKDVQRAHRVSLFKIFTMMPYSKFYLIAIVALVSISAPISVWVTLGPLIPELTLPDVINIGIWAFAFVTLAFAERMFYLATRLSAAARPEEMLLRDDIRALRAYSSLTNGLLARMVPAIGVSSVKDVLARSTKHGSPSTGLCASNFTYRKRPSKPVSSRSFGVRESRSVVSSIMNAERLKVIVESDSFLRKPGGLAVLSTLRSLYHEQYARSSF